jgi:hypothetical protein
MRLLLGKAYATAVPHTGTALVSRDPKSSVPKERACISRASGLRGLSHLTAYVTMASGPERLVSRGGTVMGIYGLFSTIAARARI